jgi:hypothetical protein
MLCEGKGSAVCVGMCARHCCERRGSVVLVICQCSVGEGVVLCEGQCSELCSSAVSGGSAVREEAVL